MVIYYFVPADIILLRFFEFSKCHILLNSRTVGSFSGIYPWIYEYRRCIAWRYSRLAAGTVWRIGRWGRTRLSVSHFIILIRRVVVRVISGNCKLSWTICPDKINVILLENFACALAKITMRTNWVPRARKDLKWWNSANRESPFDRHEKLPLKDVELSHWYSAHFGVKIVSAECVA